MILVVIPLPTGSQLLAERREAFDSFRVWRLPGWSQVSQCRVGGVLQKGVPSSGLPIGVNTLVRPLHEAVSEDCRTSGVQYISNSDHYNILTTSVLGADH